MDTLAIFGLQFSLSLVLFGLLAKWFLAPWLQAKPPSEALFWLTLPHAVRYLGMVFLVPGVVSPSLPASFAVPAGYGDLAAGVLAMLVLIALRHNWAGSVALVWVFNVVGTVDLLNALSHAEIVQYLGAAWYIPTMFVPVLLITHLMIFVRLLKKAKKHGGRDE
ncbi:MAG: hypothetical protein O7C74_00465 [Acidobacteria bacterium]|nr:hypothetical protein [Acidobacteriota bacterium]MCZ6649080.1 hypothetical protein [Acidobacteriota bacterium]MCZ6745670.1 hypothetical protein [Acidobacteriota bacterium]